MIELVDSAPAVDVPAAEYARLLGFPRGYVFEGRSRELADAARAWYAQLGRPWIYARQAEAVAVHDDAVTIDDERFAAPHFAGLLRQADCAGLVLVAVSAGPEIEAAAAQAWREEKPDEYFFLEIFGSAVVEHLTTTAGARLCAWADGQSLAVLPHMSPGYPQWDVAEQPRLVNVLKRSGRRALPASLEVLDSGMLRPKKSMLAVFGLTRQTDRVRRLAELSPCETCCYAGCDYRRAAYRGPSPLRPVETPLVAAAAAAEAPLALAARYGVNGKALARWARERLTLVDRDDGAIEARFRYDGTTCKNMGRPLAFDYTVRLGRRDDCYPIERQHCAPSPGDDGHRQMCRYLDDGDALLATIADEQPLAGAPLDDVLAWPRPMSAAGCYCDVDSREHKWGLVLETIHFALAERERSLRRETVPPGGN